MTPVKEMNLTSYIIILYTTLPHHTEKVENPLFTFSILFHAMSPIFSLSPFSQASMQFPNIWVILFCLCQITHVPGLDWVYYQPCLHASTIRIIYFPWNVILPEMLMIIMITYMHSGGIYGEDCGWWWKCSSHYLSHNMAWLVYFLFFPTWLSLSLRSRFLVFVYLWSGLVKKLV